MTLALVLAAAVTLGASIPIVARVKREYEGEGVLSPFTVAAVWVLYVAIVLVAAAAAAAGTWSLGLSDSAAIAIGAALLLVGAAIEVAGLASMASLRRMSGVQPDRLITSGAFRFSRNPQNVGIGIALVGVAIVGDSALALAVSAGFWTVFRVYVGYEEQHLSRTFGGEYDRYREQTPRFLGLPSAGS